MQTPRKYAARLAQAVQEIRASYWFIPACLVVAAVIAAWGINTADHWVREAEFALPRVVSDLDRDGARTLLSTIASSVIGVTGVMFSLTLVAVTHAAGKYGPRLIGNFLRDRGNQWTLGVLIAIFAFAMVNLWLMGGPEDEVPHLVVFATFLSIFPAIAAVIFFVHHVPETINVSNIVAGLGARLSAKIRAEIEDGLEDGAEDGGDGAAALPDREPDARLFPTRAGYVQAVSFDALEDWAEEHGAVLRLEAMPGDFVQPKEAWLSLWDAEPGVGESDLDGAIALGLQPTESQTATFVVDQLVEMTALALSPGINDPFTAITCLRWLSAGLTEALAHEGGLRPRPDGRVKRRRLTFERLYAHGFPAAMPYVADDRMAAHAAAEMLAALAEHASDPRTRRRILADAGVARAAGG